MRSLATSILLLFLMAPGHVLGITFYIYAFKRAAGTTVTELGFAFPTSLLAVPTSRNCPEIIARGPLASPTDTSRASCVDCDLPIDSWENVRTLQLNPPGDIPYLRLENGILYNGGDSNTRRGTCFGMATNSINPPSELKCINGPGTVSARVLYMCDYT